jgi:hypothetical protein
MEKRPFVIDAQNEFNTDQIWNQPAFRYTVHRFEVLGEAEAANLVASGGERRQGDQNDYLWNSNARGFAFIDVALHWVSETPGPNAEMVSGMETARETRMVAVIELDRDPADPEALIIGGEYLDDPQVGANRLRVPPFVWLAFDAGPDFAHNPFVSADRVKELVALALGADAPPPAPSCPHAACAEGAKLAPSCGTCEEQVCGEDAFCCASEWDAVCVQLAAARCGCL